MDEQTLFLLGEFLNENLSLQTCDSTLYHTENWLLGQGIADSKAELEWLEKAGAHCDCEVVLKLYVRLREVQKNLL